jgi:hypothetical protein
VQPTLKNTRSKSPNVHARIKKILVSYGARGIHEEYDDQQRLCALSFDLLVHGRLLSYRVPARIEQVEAALRKDGRIHPNQVKTQAYQTAWANIRDWLDINLAMSRLTQMETSEVFLSFQITPSGATVYDVIKDRQFLLPPTKVTVDDRGDE